MSVTGEKFVLESRDSCLDLKILRQQSQAKIDEVINFSIHEEIEENIEEPTRLWYKEAVFYEVYVRAFCDSNGDGYGDLQGLTSRLDYLSSLGVNCIWLLPIYPSPLKDDGYDVADYVGIHPHYGSLRDFQTLVKAVHERNMRIIADFIPNHSSDQHEWFQKSRRDRNGPYRDYYVWSDDPHKYQEARIIFCDTEKSNWTWDEVAGQYYWHRFYSSQPDLNYENPKVREEMINVMRFWLDMGIDGFRVDAVPYLFEEEGTNCENLPQGHEYLKEIRKMMDKEYPGRILLAEACQMPDEVREYFGDGDEFHMGFHFPVMPRIYMSIRAEDYSSLKKILEETPDIPSNCQWVTFLRNHDELTLEMVTPEERRWMWEQYAPDVKMRINMGIRRRLAPLFDNDRRRIELAHSMLLTLPGSPILYYGDEIGMGDNINLPDRNGVRTPMQWDNSKPHAGFSTAANTYAPVINTELYGPHRVNVRDAQNDPSALYNVLRHMIFVRRRHQSLGSGKLKWVDCEMKEVACWIRYYRSDVMLIVSNLSGQEKTADITLPSKFTINQGTFSCSEVLMKNKYSIRKGILSVTLSPYQFLWLNLDLYGIMSASQRTDSS
jgi:trehalose synthase